ncbi:MAG: alpha/beta hydrolase [Treponema sp.]|jgi:pimeloyl-ACP methyl ester carboxylesterase|nr:alpha/beta hydrolase [Treponema sp.]
MRKTAFSVVVLCFLMIVPLCAQEKKYSDYSLKGLQSYPYKASTITIEKLAFKTDLQYAYNVVYTSMDLTVSARLSIPAIPSRDIKGIVLMLRGYQNPRGYYTGKGTENPARGYLREGWAVIAPDFLGYASSSPIPSPGELHQFYSTVNAVELYRSLEQPDFRFASPVPQADRIALPENFKKITAWGHSNGGQVSLHFLEVIQKPVPTVLWAPVCIDFPDSAAHFGRSPEWASRFRETHPAQDFSLIDNLDKIAAGTPILLEQGDKDASVPKSWSDALAKAIESENDRREQAGTGKIRLRYEVYLNADHNLRPFWDKVLPGNAAFWDANP